MVVIIFLKSCREWVPFLLLIYESWCLDFSQYISECLNLPRLTVWNLKLSEVCSQLVSQGYQGPSSPAQSM